MQTTTLLYIILALLISVAVAFFQYFYKEKKTPKITVLLFALKAFSLFVLSLLFINPKIKSEVTSTVKPVLSVLIDNSLSTKYFKQEENVKTILKNIKENSDLNDKFDVSFFSIGENTQVLDSLSFNEPKTNIENGLQAVANLYKDNIASTVLISDGNQTIGNDYEFTNTKQAVYPLIIGDTTQYKDVRISKLNVNKYSYIKNKFPVETLLYYEGNESVTTQFSIYSKGKTIFTQKVSFSADKKTQTITANLTSTTEGQQYYTASVRKLKDEKNTKNNSKIFSVEVIDEQTKVLILTSVLHPDIGALKKAIESNKQRKVDVILIDNYKKQINDYQLVVFYQPNNKFNDFLVQRKSNFMIVSGSKTDWNFMNSQQLGFSKKAINQPEDYAAIYNDSFLTFLQKDIGFANFPPLEDKFGEVTITKPHQTLVYQKIAGIATEQSLIATFDETDKKYAVIFGENLWKWRSTSFRQDNSFEEFDAFMGNLVQYVASTKKRNRLEVNAESLYPANSTIAISAFYVDKNYQFDNRASLQLTFTNTDSKESKVVPFSLVNNSYQVELENVSTGNYTYKVTVVGENVTKYGRFKVTDYQVEEQFTNSNHKKLQKLADRTGGKLFYGNQSNNFIQELINNKNYYSTLKSVPKEQNLIDWKWILALAALLLSLEWFIRKYYGKI
ncbi:MULTISPECIES: VWA domain-containing protein [Tenacibaculum]|uniref:VWA domain-containing protein n=1 Tax=Tenacibaculum TaxID=104267 RepID=UPI001F0ACB79|nr:MULTISPECIES: VWA domain-containing protein [Tenacibaculum]MCH3882239.1 VWA domain-containing protein [Tenacibaculum aquimarinum]MDO6599872.1 VWA domain-containing protein [Tenacibaculum sp. 1_MG-2023]